MNKIYRRKDPFYLERIAEAFYPRKGTVTRNSSSKYAACFDAFYPRKGTGNNIEPLFMWWP